MDITIYRSSIKDGLYVYVPSDANVADLPEAVKKQLGAAEKSLSFELTEDRKLPNADAKEVLESVASQGFYIQMPADIETVLANIAEQNVKNANRSAADSSADEDAGKS